MKKTAPLVPVELIAGRIFVIREDKVLLDEDLASLYGVATKRLNEQVRRIPDGSPTTSRFDFRISILQS